MSNVDEFIRFNEGINSHLIRLCSRKYSRLLYKVDVPKGLLWNAYLNHLPNSVRQSHLCSCCKLFIERYGTLVGIGEDYQLISMWDFDSSPTYQSSLNVMRDICTKAPIKNLFLTRLDYLGKRQETKQSIQTLTAYEDRYLSVLHKTITTHKSREHLCVSMSHWYYFDKVYKRDKESNLTLYKQNYKSNKELLKVTLENLNVSSIKSQIDSLITESKLNSDWTRGIMKFIKMGAVVKGGGNPSITTLSAFLDLHKEYYSLVSEERREVFCWHHSPKISGYLNVLSTLKDK